MELHPPLLYFWVFNKATTFPIFLVDGTILNYQGQDCFTS